ncbi:MAG: GT4 family glycosyltransferase PelF [Candidatus Marinimicrobia bacterium]|jgi:glycosyltransferase involved in cell wall biosynthesis|nr:GT4 family glycosyltransferase PelF [Candidatus Neomarinimicrobiota bacterium]MBT3936145.1 GT4 family glycosyltransferase PelF [Candidatus Neomarinimicrobiota bacterium]MBT3961116.1 GT4 family glycosyltransferase PelF [Candidatus Neomarinimicrobiota bacterium]MBT4383042.1 GT4 family glycosyltransferase PelF [Candidatus Neomarinimicrobiota bacterium]MBT4636462.1 GT4 family glycosyltransferase PelF [Candidatus Neomarinimicrobiota bacterium]
MTIHKKKCIVFFIGQIGIGGTEKQMTLLLKYFNHNKYEYHIMVFNQSPFGDLKNEIEKTRAIVHFIPGEFQSIPARIWYLYKWLKENAPATIHSWTVHDNAYAGILGKVLGVKNIIGSLRGSINGTGYSRMPHYLKWASLNLANNIVVNSKVLKNELLNMGIPKKRVTIIPNSVEVVKTQMTHNNLDKPIICTIGNLRQNKNQLFFIRVMKKVIDVLPNVEGWIIGQPVNDEPEMKEKLENEINLLKLTGQVKLLGFQLDTKGLLKKSSIFVLPSISEGQPNTILEAMSLGIPVVASNVGGIPELISHQRNGLLFDPKDVDGFVHGILTLLRDENVKTKFMKNSFKAVQNKRNIRQMAQSYHILYNGVII